MRPDSTVFDHAIADLDIGDFDNADFVPPPRPRTRGDRVDGPRPCPWFSCRHHLGLDFTSGGKLKVRELDELAETCSLDVAERNADGGTLDQVGQILEITRERVRQIEQMALARMNKAVRNLTNE
jgi:hypothetical protein